MLSLHKIAAGQNTEDYYLGLTRYFRTRRKRKGRRPEGLDESGDDFGDPDDDLEPDALTMPGEPPGVWMGGGADYHGLDGNVEGHSLRSLFRGYHPATNRPVVQNAGHHRQPAWDFTFSVPKSVSVVWSQASPEIREQIENATRDSVRDVLAEIERGLIFSRIGKADGDLRWVSAKPVFAAFEHGSSRADDANLHWHCLLLNLGVRPDGTTGTIDSRFFYRPGVKKVLGAQFRTLLATRLRDIGFATVRVGTSFEIDGVPRNVIDAHSTRRNQILRDQERRGTRGAKDAGKACLTTRQAKTSVPSRNERFRHWQERNSQLGFTTKLVDKLAARRPRPVNQQSTARKAIEAAIRNVTAKSSHFTANGLRFEALVEAAGRGVSHDAIGTAVENYLRSSAVVPLEPVKGVSTFTTAAILSRLQKLLSTADELRQRPGVRTKPSALRRVLRRYPTINAEQRTAVHWLVEGEGAVRFVRGLAGTGKTSYVMKPTFEAFQASGIRVIGVAPTNTAAAELREKSGMPTTSIARLTGDYSLPFSYYAGQAVRSFIHGRPARFAKPPAMVIDNGPLAKTKHHARQIGRALRGRPTSRKMKPTPVKIDRKTVIVVDEAGMVNERQFKLLLDMAKRRAATILFLGDPSQLPPVEGCAPFLSLSTRHGAAELKLIARQKGNWAKEAAKLFEAGAADIALAMYAARGLVEPHVDLETARAAMVEEWVAYGRLTPEDAAILVHNNEQVEAVNKACQEARRTVLDTSRFVTIRDEDIALGRSYANRAFAGDRVLFTANSSRPHRVNNGTFGTVVAIKGNWLSVSLDTGKRVEFHARRFPHIRLGYAMTVYRAQGKDIPYVFILAGGPQQDQASTYVQATRATTRTKFFTTHEIFSDVADAATSPLAEQMKRTKSLALATDLIPGDATRTTARGKLFGELLCEWSKNALHSPQGHVIVTASEPDARRVNELCQAVRLANVPHGERDMLTFGGSTYLRGDRVRFTKGWFGIKAREGKLATVEKVTPARQCITVRYDTGFTDEFCLAQFSHFEHAYALTAAQAADLPSKYLPRCGWAIEAMYLFQTATPSSRCSPLFRPAKTYCFNDAHYYAIGTADELTPEEKAAETHHIQKRVQEAMAGTPPPSPANADQSLIDSAMLPRSAACASWADPKIDSPSTTPTIEEVRLGLAAIHLHHTILFGEGHVEQGILPGDTGIIAAIDETARTFDVRLNAGPVVTLPLHEPWDVAARKQAAQRRRRPPGFRQSWTDFSETEGHDYEMILLSYALDDNTIEVRGRGNGGDSVLLDIRSRLPNSIEITVPTGTYFAPENASLQNMVVTASTVVVATPDWQTFAIPAACANRFKAAPVSANTLHIYDLPPHAELIKLIDVLPDASSHFVAQAAVWIVTDNVTVNHRGSLHDVPKDIQTKLVIAYAEALQLCHDADIDITKKAVWNDRHFLKKKLPGGELYEWLRDIICDE